MKSPIFWIASTTLLLLLVCVGWQDALELGLPALPRRMHAGVLMLGGIAVLFGLIFWIVHSEDASTRREAVRCRERSICTRADLALVESELLLGRLGAVGPGSGPDAQLALIRAELGQLQRQSALDDPLLAARMELLCARVDRVAQAVRGRSQALDPG